MSSGGNFTWESSAEDVHGSSIAGSVSGLLSSFIAFVVVAWYWRHRTTGLRTSINDVMVFSILFGGIGALNAGMSSCIRLLSPTAMQHYCDMSGIMVQLFTMPSGMALSMYFWTVVRRIQTGRSSFSDAHKRIGVCLVFGIVSSAAAFSAIPSNPEWGTHMAPTAQPWCWIPTQSSDGKPEVGYIVASVFLAQLWYLTALVTGAMCLYKVRGSWIATMGASERLPLFFYSKVVYLVYYLMVWVFAEISNINPNLSMSEAITAPTVCMVDALVFYYSERFGTQRPPKGDEEDALEDEQGHLIIPARGDKDFASINTVVKTMHHVNSRYGKGSNQFQEAQKSAFTIRYDENSDHWIIVPKDSNDSSEAGVLTSNEEVEKVPSEAFLELLAQFRTPDLNKRFLNFILCLLAGYCDCCGFLTMELFTAHITGNFCTIGMALSSKGSVMLKAVGIVTFGVFLMIATTVVHKIPYAPRVLMGLQSMLLLMSWIFSQSLGYREEGSVGVYCTGLSMVAGMAIQNVFQRFFLKGLPMTTLMTGNSTGLIVELCNPQKFWKNKEGLATIKNNGIAILAFTVGCVIVTVMKEYAGHWIFFPPPFVCIASLAMAWKELAA